MDRKFKGMDDLFSTGRFGLEDFEGVRMDCWTKNGANLRESKKNRPLQADGTKVQYYFETAIT